MSKNAMFKKFVSAYVTDGSEQRWRVKLPDGRGGQNRKQGFLTQAHALAWAATEYERTKLGYVESSQSFCEFAEIFLLQEKEVKPSTKGSYEEILRLYICPFFKSLPMSELNVQVGGDFLRRLNIDKAISGTHKRKIFSIFKMVYREALTRGYATDYRVMTLSLPKKDTQEATCWATEELNQFVTSPIVKSDPRHYLWLSAALIGARAGELMALEWADVDLDSDTPSIRFNKRRCQKSGEVFQGTKNGDSRTIPLIPDAVDLLREYRSNCGKVFPKTKVFNQEWDQKHFARDLRVACRKVGVTELTFHQLRHSFLTWLGVRGVDTKLISMLAGHRDERVTQLYVHRSPEMQRLYWERNKTKLNSLQQNSSNFADEGSDSVVISNGLK